MIEQAYAMAPAVAPAAGTSQSAGIITALMPVVLMVVVFYFLLIRPQQKKQKQHQEMLATLKKGDTVITNAGFYGIIEEVHEDFFMISFGGTPIKTLRSSVSVLVTEDKK